MMDEKTKKALKSRLNRVEGQISGIQRMVEEDKYCVDVLLQISAVRGALGQVGKIVLGRHIETCVSNSLSSGNQIDRREKIDELMEVFARYGGIGGK
jgi:DNA-binding FrmR family transcriptional regulator